MPYTEAVDVRVPEESIADSIKLYVSPDAVRGRDDDTHKEGGWDWLADGYMVLKTSPARHDGQPATLMMLADSDGQREVGRLVLRNDALRDARLVVTRQFETDEDLYVFSHALEMGGGTDEVKTVEVDMVFEEDLLADLQMVTEGTSIAYRVVNMHGPGGGNPVIAFTGKDRELRAMLRKHWSMDEADLADFLG